MAVVSVSGIGESAVKKKSIWKTTHNFYVKIYCENNIITSLHLCLVVYNKLEAIMTYWHTVVF